MANENFQLEISERTNAKKENGTGERVEATLRISHLGSPDGHV